MAGPGLAVPAGTRNRTFRTTDILLPLLPLLLAALVL